MPHTKKNFFFRLLPESISRSLFVCCWNGFICKNFAKYFLVTNENAAPLVVTRKCITITKMKMKNDFFALLLAVWNGKIDENEYIMCIKDGKFVRKFFSFLCDEVSSRKLWIILYFFLLCCWEVVQMLAVKKMYF